MCWLFCRCFCWSLCRSLCWSLCRSLCWSLCRSFCWSFCWSFCRCFCWLCRSFCWLCRSYCWLCRLLDFLVVNGYSYSLVFLRNLIVLIRFSIGAINCRGKDLTFTRSHYPESDCIKLATARLIKRTIMCVIIIIYNLTVFILGEISAFGNRYLRRPIAIKLNTERFINRIEIWCVAFPNISIRHYYLWKILGVNTHWMFLFISYLRGLCAHRLVKKCPTAKEKNLAFCKLNVSIVIEGVAHLKHQRLSLIIIGKVNNCSCLCRFCWLCRSYCRLCRSCCRLCWSCCCLCRSLCWLCRLYIGGACNLQLQIPNPSRLVFRYFRDQRLIYEYTLLVAKRCILGNLKADCAIMVA